MTKFHSTPNGKVPFTAEEEALAEAQAASVLLTRYKEQRQLEYPAIADYLDGIVKGDQAQVQAYIAACLAVKAKYPKSE
jgi:hypothetical protein